MQWSLSRKMTSNRARYLNQDLIVLVRCRKPVIFRVGICVGIGWVVSIVLSVLYYTTAYPMGVSLYFAVILVAFAIASVVLCIWLKKKGTIIFANLSA